MFKIKDFGPIKEAEIEIGKINVIAGVNGSGKSTASKILYSFLVSLTNQGNYYHNNLIDDIIGDILRFQLDGHVKKDNPNIDYSKDLFLKFNKVRDKILDNTSDVNEVDELLEYLKNNEYMETSRNFKQLIEDLEYNLSIMKNSNKRKSFIFENIISNEFRYDILHNDKTLLSLLNEGRGFSVENQQNNLSSNYNEIDFPVLEVFYIETPFIFDIFQSFNWTLSDRNYLKETGGTLYHQKSLFKKLGNDKKFITYNRQNNENKHPSLDILQKIMSGKLIYDNKKEEFFYRLPEKDNYIQNTATGIKAIGILHRLLYNGLDTNSFIIMDEPEVHLHPSWQLKLAEAIVLLSKQENITFYINSHSPHFIEAIEVYSQYYGIGGETNFYLTEQDNGKFSYKKVPRKNLKKIYRNLGDPYNVIDEIRGFNLANEL